MHLSISRLFFSVSTSLVLASLSLADLPAQADQQTCVITNDGATVCGRLTKQQPKKSNSASGQRKEVGQFTYVLKGCKRSDTTIKCSYSITNKGTEITIRLHSESTSLIDAKGKSYLASNIEAGGQSRIGMDILISPGIDYAVEVAFENIPEQITQVPIFKPDQNVQFRNVTFIN